MQDMPVDKPTFIALRWRKIQFSAQGIPALVAVVIIALGLASSLVVSPTIGCRIFGSSVNSK